MSPITSGNAGETGWLKLAEVGCKNMSGVDKDEEPAYRLYFYSVCIFFSHLSFSLFTPPSFCMCLFVNLLFKRVTLLKLPQALSCVHVEAVCDRVA